MKTLNTEKFLSPDNPILTKAAEEISPTEILSLEVQRDIEEMLKIAYGEQQEKDKPLLVGLAAPQIGISKRIILVDVTADGKGEVKSDLRVYINPEIVSFSEEKEEWYEGCFSTSRVCGIVSRPSRITVEAMTREGKPIKEDHSGYIARVFQHEIDHLNGIEFTTHISDVSNLHWVERDEFPEYRNKQGWRNWPKKCSREKWEKIKGIRK
ncbi:MAG TPA: peptide deformylase [Candidatus Paceibacterota bacterium]|nr:peptide deformylase [Candidatus Paceibacterota bacterium]